MGGDYDLAFTDGASWTIRNRFSGGRGLGNRATVWDAEVTAMAETLRLSKGKRLLILSDSQAAIAAVVPVLVFPVFLAPLPLELLPENP